jgi:hypothetical protein
MGTRNLTIVIYQEKTRIAQYAQWDGYPSGQGATILDFLKKHKTPSKMKAFKEKLLQVKFVDEIKQKEIDAFFQSIGTENGWMDMEQANKYHAKYPLHSRDNGAQTLEMIMNTKEDDLWLHDSTSFAADSLFCEYAYVIDLDKNNLEVYVGFVKKPLAKKERFYFLTEIAKKDHRDDSKYYPIKLAVKYSLDALPTVAKMTKDVQKKESKS